MHVFKHYRNALWNYHVNIAQYGSYGNKMLLGYVEWHEKKCNKKGTKIIG